MKELEKLAEDFVEIRRGEIFNEESQPTDPAWFIPVYVAGFRKAREMAAKIADQMEMNEFGIQHGDYRKTFDELGEREIE